MAKSVLDIVIKLSKQGGADKETVTGLVKVKSAIMEAAAVAGTMVAAGYAIKKAFDATAGAFVSYADQVRTTSRATQLSAEESSKLIQVTDDLGVSYETLEKAIKSSADTTDFSIAGLAKASEEYLNIENAQKRAAFAQKLYGKAWTDMVGVLEKGPDAIQDASDAISDSLVLTEDAVRSAREYEIAVDNLNDSWMALKITIGQAVLPTVTQMIDGLNNTNIIREKANQLLEEGIARNREEALSLATTSLQYGGLVRSADQASAARWNGLASIYETANATQTMADANGLVIRTTEEMNAQNSEFLKTLGSMQSAEESYQEKAKSLTEERMALEQQKRDLLSQGYSEQSAEIQNINAKLGENSQAAQDNASQHDLANKRIILGLLERKLTQDGILDDNELNWLLEKGVAWGIYTQEVIDESRKAIDEANGIAAAINNIPSSKDVSINVNTNYAVAGMDQIKGTNKQGRAKGTDGWETVPSGYPNDSYPIFLTSGEKFAVIPPGGGAVAGTGGVGGGGSPVIVNVNISSVINTADRERAKSELAPLFASAIRDLQLNGVLR